VADPLAWHHTRHWIDIASAAPPALRPNSPRAATDTRSARRGNGTPIDDWSYGVAWPVRPLPDAPPPGGGRWLVVGDTELTGELDRVAGSQIGIEGLESGALADEEALHGALNGVDRVLYAPPASGTSVAVAYQLFHHTRRLTAAMAAAATPAKLFIVTRNGQPTTEGDRANPAHGALWGLGRTLALEHPEIWGGIIDFDEAVPAELTVPRLLAEAAGTDGEDQVVYRQGLRHVPRLQHRALPTQAVTLDGGACQLVIGATGNIGPHLIRELARMGAKTIVAVSRNPGSRLDELTESLAAAGTTLVTVAADATDETAMAALFDRFGADLPPLEGIYLAAYAGQPVL
ncbi:SDR family NAD(P)-dependent oxidoreductase, partial [Mycobacterium sp. E3305]|uniref:SDR family NAD(P)-dependent oxidoreductase n=1 Tax=Mycobacterium sp. E3305 TaxID=1834145 RepID=UPI0012E71CE0